MGGRVENEPSQLQVAVGVSGLAFTCSLSGAPLQINSNTVLINLNSGDEISIMNPALNPLTVQAANGTLVHAQAPSLVIKLISLI